MLGEKLYSFGYWLAIYYWLLYRCSRKGSPYML